MATDDIVTLLRKCFEIKQGDFRDLLTAADEIERLREELVDWKRTVRALEEQLAEETSGYE